MTQNPLRLALKLALLALIWAGASFDYSTHTTEHREQFKQLGEALVGASEGVVLRLCRGGRYDPQEVQTAIEELRVSVGAERLVLSSSELGVLVETGPEDPSVKDSVRVFSTEFAVPGRRGFGHRGPGPPGLVELPGRDLSLQLELSTATLQSRLTADWRRFLGLAGALSVSLQLFSVLLNARVRAVAMASDLGQAREKLHGLEFLRRLGAGLAHETRTPLGVLRGFAQELSSGSVPAERVPSIANTIIEQADRTVSRLDEFMLLSRPAELRRERFDLWPLLEELGELLQPDLEAVDGDLQLEAFNLEIDADREQTRRLFMNLMLNGVQSLSSGGSLRVSLGRDPGGPLVRVQDDGAGVPAELQESLFEPYATRREGGTGLGLAIVRRIASEHGWQVTHQAVSPHGALFTVRGFGT